MQALPSSLQAHRVQSDATVDVMRGRVVYAPVKSLWFGAMAGGALVGAPMTASTGAVLLFVISTAAVLLFGHSLGSHRRLIHGSFQCPRWLERWLVWMGVMVGLSGPIGLVRQHDLRDYAQRLPLCHPYLRHGSAWWKDAWWQLHCELVLDRPPAIRLEPRIAQDRFLQLLERTWMLQQLPVALLFYFWGGWGFVFWGVCARVTAGVFGHWLIGYFAHNRGGLHFVVDGAAVQGRNIAWTSLLTMGESWHNNHHAYPGSARLGLAPGEWDPGWWVLAALHRLGLVWDIRLPRDLGERHELRPLRPAPEAERRSANPRAAVLWRLARSHDVERIDCPDMASRLPLVRAVAGHAPVQVHAQARRLHVRAGGHSVAGLPGVWLALASRGRGLRLLLLALLPLALAAEVLRNGLTLEGAPADR